jgi:hypothetical protein
MHHEIKIKINLIQSYILYGTYKVNNRSCLVKTMGVYDLKKHLKFAKLLWLKHSNYVVRLLYLFFIH